MTPTWYSDDLPDLPAPSAAGWCRIVMRAVPIGGVLATGLGLMLVMRLIEAPLCRRARPVTPWITVIVCRLVLRLIGLRRTVTGAADPGAGLLVANHASWLDIFVLNAVRPVYFVAKSEVGTWPGISWLAKVTGTMFVARDPRQAAAQAAVLRDRLAAGHRLILFPEGTSTDGRRVLRFRSSMFAAVDAGAADLQLQPISVTYHAPPGTDARFYGWWGDMEMGPHLLLVLAQAPQGRVELHHHASLRPSDVTGRKALAEAAETAVRAGVARALAASAL